MKKNNPAQPSPRKTKVYSITLTEFAEAYLADVVRKYRVTPEAFIQASAEQAMSAGCRDDEVEMLYVDQTLELIETGDVENYRQDWLTRYEPDEPAKNGSEDAAHLKKEGR